MAWNLTPPELITRCQTALDSAAAGIARTLSRPASDRSFDNTLQPIEEQIAVAMTVTTPLRFLYLVSPDAAVRDSATECDQRATAFFVQVGTDPQIYAAAKRSLERGAFRTAADKQLARLYVEAGRRAGAGLDSAARLEVTTLFQQLADLQRDYSIALAKDSSRLVIAAADTAGLPAQFRSVMTESSGGGYSLRVNESTFRDFEENQRSADARERFYVVYNNRGGAANITRLQRALVIRDSLAHLLGFPTWAAYQLDGKMAKDPARVVTFLQTIDSRLLERAHEEVARLGADAQRGGTPTPVSRWDFFYYNERYRRARYALDNNVLRQYFPVDHVVEAVLGVYGDLLGLRFTEIKPASAWAPDVREIAVADAASGRALGRLYLDLYPRPDKYGHFADFTIVPTRRLSDGSRLMPSTAIVGNWPVGEPGKPALLTHGDVVVFFHEFGHAMAAVLDASPYLTTGSMGVRQDFVEAPSQMLENWMWQPAILKRVSRHVSTGQPLPDTLIQRMIALKHLNDGVSWTSQAFLALYDMTLHSSPPAIDVSATWAEMYPRTTAFRLPQGVLPAASFGHLMGGYDAGYYGYLWSRVYAQDMFTRFEREGLLNAAVGRAYRDDVLAPAATEEPDVLVHRFLGRNVAYDAFYRDVGITPKAKKTVANKTSGSQE